MKSLVVYESMWGNTAEVAEAIATGLGDARLLSASVTSTADLEGIDLLVIGGPTHALTMSRPDTRDEAHREGAPEAPLERGVRELIKELPDHVRPRCATFDTRVGAMRHLPGSASKTAARALRRGHDGDVVATRSFYVKGAQGPLLEGERDRAAAWGEQLVRLVAATGGERHV